MNALHFNETGNLLASGSDDLDIIVWNWSARGECDRKRASFDSGHKANVFQSKFLPLRGDTHIVSTSRDGQVRLSELDGSGALRAGRRLAGHRGPANKLALLADRPHTFLSGGEDSVVFEIDVRENKPTKLLVQKEGDGDSRKVPIYSVDASPVDENLFCTSGRDRHIRMYDRRKIAEGTAHGPLKKFCPHHMVSATRF